MAKSPAPHEVSSIELLKLKQSGFGSMTSPEIDQWVAQRVLAARLNHLYPKRLKNLRESCLQKYIELFETGKRFMPDQVRDIAELPIVIHGAGREVHKSLLIDSWAHLELAASQHDIARELRDCISGWVQDLNLWCTWFMDDVVRILMVWRLSPETATRPLFFVTGGMSVGADRRLGFVTEDLNRLIYSLAPVRATFSVAGYNPASQTRKEHTHEVLTRLRAHQGEQEQRFAAAGFTNSRAKRAKKRRLWEEIDWLLSYQIAKRSAAEIASKVQIGESISEVAVLHGIRKAADLLQIAVRSSDSARAKKLKRKR